MISILHVWRRGFRTECPTLDMYLLKKYWMPTYLNAIPKLKEKFVFFLTVYVFFSLCWISQDINTKTGRARLFVSVKICVRFHKSIRTNTNKHYFSVYHDLSLLIPTCASTAFISLSFTLAVIYHRHELTIYFSKWNQMLQSCKCFLHHDLAVWWPPGLAQCTTRGLYSALAASRCHRACATKSIMYSYMCNFNMCFSLSHE